MDTYMIVIVAIIGLLLIKFFYLGTYPYLSSMVDQKMALKDGVVVNAEIIAAKQTTLWVDDDSIFKLKIRYKTKEGKMFNSLTMKALPFNEIMNYRKGAQVTIKYLPKKPKIIALLTNF